MCISLSCLASIGVWVYYGLLFEFLSLRTIHVLVNRVDIPLQAFPLTSPFSVVGAAGSLCVS